ncbi:RRM domain-containing protein [Heracleum sosnowskyi]|uniref:RRM domain-containing protein n=1 Tax=Heracleum sosnowskyi TaxID=360622 RepID=A0AAD8JJC1_9APIA|nr:RRM domain-containing protein [Heracleum sosnowskyi]
MENTGFINFTGILDPGAQEFIPPSHFPSPPQIIYSYPYTTPNEFPGTPYPNTTQNEFAYTQYYPPQGYIRVDPPPLPVSLPPASNMPSRALLLSSVPTEVSESTVRRDLEVYGDVRAVEMERVGQGIVAVHFYDIRHAETALVEIQEQHMQQQFRLRQHFDAVFMTHDESALCRFPVPVPLPAFGLVSGRAVWAQFMFPVGGGYPEAFNQGSLVIFNVDCQVPTSHLREIFEEFGCVKEVRETPMKQNQRFIEFYDTRDAAKACIGMNGKEINGRHLIIEYSRPGGHNKRFPKTPHNKLNCNSSHPPRGPRLVAPHQALPDERSAPIANKQCSRVQPQLPSRNMKNPNGSRKTSSGQDAQEVSLCVSGAEGVEISKKNSKRSGSTCSGNGGGGANNLKQVSDKRATGCNGKGWKGVGSAKNEKEYDPRFLINEDSILLSNCSDPRTTVMIKNIPNKYSQKLLLNMLDNHCIHCNEQIADGDDQPLSSYDFVYLPIDFVNKCNVGYGFVNMTSPEATLRLYKSFHLQNWEVFNSRKICQVTYARLQGVEALKEHFKSSKFPCDAEEYMPVVFSPPRDGNTLTSPVPIISRGAPTESNNTDCNKDNEEECYYINVEDAAQQQEGQNVNNINDDCDNDVMIRGCDSGGAETALEAMRLFDENL